MPMLAAIIAVVMEVPAAILIVIGFFTRPLAVLFIFLHAGHGGNWSPLLGTGDAVGPNMINFWKNVSIAGAFLLLGNYRAGGDFSRSPLGKMPDAA